MCIIIAVSGKDFSGAEALAAVLAEQFGLLLVKPLSLIARAEEWGADRDKLWSVVENPPGLLRRLAVDTYVHLRVMRGLLGEQIRERDLVCYGAVADLLPAVPPEVFRIQVQAAHSWRLQAVQETRKLDRRAATKVLQESDRRQRRWCRYVHGLGRASSSGTYDLTVNLEDMGIDGACGLIEAMIARRTTRTEKLSAVLQEFILASRIQAELALEPTTRHLEIDVEVSDGVATLRGTVRDPDDLDAMKLVASLVRGVKLVDTSKVRLLLGAGDFPLSSHPSGPVIPDVAGTRSQDLPRPRFRPAYVLSAVGAVVALSFVLLAAGRWIKQGWPRRPVQPLQTFAGFVTDTVCASTRRPMQQDAECVRACARRPGVKYALYDSNRAYALSDQLAAEPFAARRVVVRGFVEQNTGDLHVASIKASQ